MTISISHQAIADQVKASVALENLMHPDTKTAPVLTANDRALDAAVGGTLLAVAAVFGRRATDIAQSEGQTTIELPPGDAQLRNLLEQAAVASLLEQCFSTVAPRLASRYGERLATLTAQLAMTGASGVRIKEHFD